MLIISGLLAAAAATATGPWVQTLTKGNKKITKFHFYVHNLEGGPTTTVYVVANASITSASRSSFGRLEVFDDRVTAIALNTNFYITAGEFNRSTFGMTGRLPSLEPVREMPVVGGTGAFRLARGYAVSTVYSFDSAMANSVFEYTIYVITPVHELVWTGA